MKRLISFTTLIVIVITILSACSMGGNSKDMKATNIVNNDKNTNAEVSNTDVNQFKTPEGFDLKKEGVEYGKMDNIEYYSTTTETKRKANVLLPPKYNPEKKYPVLYLLHGIGGDENEWLQGNPQNVMGNLIGNNEAKEMIVVIPNVRARKNDAGNPSDIFTLDHFKAFDNFINDLTTNLMPYIEKNYSVATGRNNTAIAGLSMGGRESLYIGVTKPEVFGYIGAFCPAFGVLKYSNNGVGEDGLITPESFCIPKEYKTFIMIVAGTNDTVVKGEPKKYHDTLVNNKMEHIYYETEGGHDFNVWKNGLYNFAKKIFNN